MSTFKVGQHVSFRTYYGEEWQTGRVVRFARGGIDVSGDRDELPEIPWNVSGEDVRPLPTHARPKPYTGPIWRERPTVADVLLLPVALLYMGAITIALLALGLLVDPLGVLGLKDRER